MSAEKCLILQVALALSMIALALVVCCALIATAELKGSRVALYGLGSGEELGADQSAFTAFGTFDGQDEMLEETLGAEYYVEAFKELQEDPKITEAVDEVKVAVDVSCLPHIGCLHIARGF